MSREDDRVAGLSPGQLSLLDQKLRAAAPSPRGQVTRRKGDGRLPLSFAQQRIWFLDRLQPGTALYNVPAVIRLKMAVDPAALRHALEEVVRRHEVLRTVFVSAVGAPVQLILPSTPMEIPVVDLRSMPEGVREAESRRLAMVEAMRSFDLERGPLFRATLVRLAEADHLLLLTLHHIVTDAWSMRVLLQEIAVLYDAFRTGRKSPLPELPIQYGDFAVWQREVLTGDTLDALLAYWKETLAGAPAVLDLPADRPRPRLQSFRGAAHVFDVDDATADGLRALAKQHSATLFMVLLASFSALLHRYTGRDDIVVGTPIANRHRAEIEPLIGFFTNTLVLRCRLAGEPTFEELLQRIRQSTLGAYAHQDLPFEKLVEEMQPERSLSHNPLFQVLFTLQITGEGTEIDASNQALPSGLAKFDLSLFFTDFGRRLMGSFEYNTDLFDASTIERISGHLRNLLEGAVANPQARISGLPILTEGERRDLLEPAQAKLRGALETVVSLFERQAARTPAAMAVASGDCSLSYADLDAAANRLAALISRRGVGAGSLVAVALERSLDLPAAVLAVLKAGAAYVPLDPEYPRPRLQYLLADAAPALVLTQERLAERLPPDLVPLVLLDQVRGEIAAQAPDAARPRPGLEDLAYVIYTSGSTGRPKGVAMPHRALANLIAWQVAEQPEPLRTLQFASLSFDVSFQEIFATLCTGGTLILPDQHARTDPYALAALLADQHVERIFLPYVALNQLAQAAAQSPPRSLRRVVTAGEKLQITPHIARFFASLPGCALHNQYGPTETHVVTEYVLSGDPSQWPASPPIGRAIDGVELYVLDRSMQPLPAGVPGELYVGGHALARDYLGRPELTRERFVRHPFRDEPGARLYRTGDVVRRMPNGTFEFIGRRDHQVKVRGYRIELGEVDTAMREHPGVREAVASVHESGTEKSLAGFYVGEVEPAVLRQFLCERIPEFLVPSSLVRVDAIPLTPSGKVDRAALPTREVGARAGEAFVAPRNPVEEVVAATWAEVLGLERVGVHDNFFELGGHSLSATQVVSRLRNAFQADVSLRAFFESPTVAELAALAALDPVRAGRQPTPIPSQREGAILDRLAELPDAEVDTLLRAMVEREGEPPRAPEPARVVPARRGADELAARVDQMSDEEVDRLLAEMLAAEHPERERR